MANETLPQKWMPKQRFWTDGERDRLVREHGEMVTALESLFENCAMIHKYGGEISNAKQADAAIEGARALLKRVRNA